MSLIDGNHLVHGKCNNLLQRKKISTRFNHNSYDLTLIFVNLVHHFVKISQSDHLVQNFQQIKQIFLFNIHQTINTRCSFCPFHCTLGTCHKNNTQSTSILVEDGVIFFFTRQKLYSNIISVYMCVKLPARNLNIGHCLFPPPPLLPTRTLYSWNDYHAKRCVVVEEGVVKRNQSSQSLDIMLVIVNMS